MTSRELLEVRSGASHIRWKSFADFVKASRDAYTQLGRDTVPSNDYEFYKRERYLASGQLLDTLLSDFEAHINTQYDQAVLHEKHEPVIETSQGI